jgi:hypothetical protein
MKPPRSTLKKRNALEERQKRGYCGSNKSAIVVPTPSWREISSWKTQHMKNSLNFESTCLKVVDTRRSSSWAGVTHIHFTFAFVVCAPSRSFAFTDRILGNFVSNRFVLGTFRSFMQYTSSLFACLLPLRVSFWDSDAANQGLEALIHMQVVEYRLARIKTHVG